MKKSQTIFFFILALEISAQSSLKFKLSIKNPTPKTSELKIDMVELVEGLIIIDNQVSQKLRSSRPNLLELLARQKISLKIFCLINSQKVISFDPLIIRLKNENMAYLEPSINLQSFCDKDSDINISESSLTRMKNDKDEYISVNFNFKIECTFLIDLSMEKEDADLDPDELIQKSMSLNSKSPQMRKLRRKFEANY